MVKEQRGVIAWLTNLVLVSLLTLPKVLPYRWRVPLLGWLAAHLVAPLAGYDKRIRANLTLVCPDMPEDEVRRLCRAVPDNAGRTLAEIYSGDTFSERVKDSPVTGPGFAAVQEAHQAGRPIVMLSAHFANYDVLRVVLTRAGIPVSAIYRPMANAYFNRHYVRAIEGIAKPLFPQTRRGIAAMVKCLRGGGVIALLSDQRDETGAALKFFGEPALTAPSAAELALKYDALLVACFSLRKESGLDFELFFDEPIPHSDAETMMQAYNDALERRVRANMDQWLWIHRRWKLPGDPGKS